MRHAVFALCLLAAPLALAYDTDGSRWTKGESTFYVDIPGTAPSGISWNQSFEGAMAEWNDATEFRFYINRDYRDPCQGYSRNTSGNTFPSGAGDSLNGVDFGTSVCGNDFGKGVLAITLTMYSRGLLGYANLAQTDIIFNQNLSWDVYQGPLRKRLDFHRTAVHELGHALGLGHEKDSPAIMAPSVSDLDRLQADDIAGANALYGDRVDCGETAVGLDMVVNDRLDDGDCAVFQLYSGGKDTSYVDVYRLQLSQQTRLSLTMESDDLDSVLLITGPNLEGIDFDDDSAGNCNARLSGNFQPGTYLILANTYDVPHKCQGNTGPYRLTISGQEAPLLTDSRSLRGSLSEAIFSGGARDQQGEYATEFSAWESIDVDAVIQPGAEHVGGTGSLHVLAILDDGRRFAKLPGGGFRLLQNGDIPAYRGNVTLKAQEALPVARNLVGARAGIAGHEVAVHVGYSMAANPGEIFFNGEAIRFTIKP